MYPTTWIFYSKGDLAVYFFIRTQHEFVLKPMLVYLLFCLVSGFEQMDFLQCCKFAEGDRFVSAHKLLIVVSHQ